MDHALIVFDMDQQRSIDPTKKADEYVSQIKADIDAEKSFRKQNKLEDKLHELYAFGQSLK